MQDLVKSFYDELADDYHHTMANWEARVEDHAQFLGAFLAARSQRQQLSILDCACGIGTQALGLASQGHRVHATDLSSVSVARARREAEARQIDITFGVADFRDLNDVPGTFDVVLAVGNALPHLSCDADIRQAVRAMASKLHPGGLMVLSTKDYDALLADRPRSAPAQVYEEYANARVVLQVRDWHADGRTYDFEQILLHKKSGRWSVRAVPGRCRAVLREEMRSFMNDEGLADIQVSAPKDSGFYQVLFTGTTPRAA